MHAYVNGNTIYNGQDMKRTQEFIKRGMDKEEVAHTGIKINRGDYALYHLESRWPEIVDIYICNLQAN